MMLHSRCNNIKIKHLHERCLRLIYCDKNSSYEELLEKDGSVSIHRRNIQNLAIEMYKVKNELAPMITANVFTTIPENHYNLRNYNGFRLHFARTVCHGTESISYLGPKYGILFLQNLTMPDPLTVLKNLQGNGYQTIALVGFVGGM